MSIIKRFDIPGVPGLMNRYGHIPSSQISPSDIYFRWQLLIGESVLAHSDLADYWNPPEGSLNYGSSTTPTLDVNLKDLLGPRNDHPGTYSLKLYTNRKPFGASSSYNLVEFYIKSISAKKDEIIIGVHDALDTDGNHPVAIDAKTLHNYAVNGLLMWALPAKNKVLSFDDGSVIDIINHKDPVGSGIAALVTLKLANPVPKHIKPGHLVKLEVAITEPRLFEFTIPKTEVGEDHNVMAHPDFTVNSSISQGPLSSRYETWDTLLGSDETVKNKLLNSFFSSSIATSAELGIDYRTYDNFVHFSSATERLANFKYKVQLSEYYDSQSIALKASTSPAAETNRIQFTTKKNDIVSKFDGYENYLYTKSSSYETGSYGAFNPSTWPKTNTSEPYILAHSTSSAAIAWFVSQSTSALDYDIDNAYNLEKTIPAHVRLDPENANYLMFVNMIGQHFDHVYNYVDHMDMIHDRQNELHLGLSKDLAWDVLKSLGWHGVNGYNFDDLWAYKLGTDSSGSYQTTDSGSTQISVNASSMPTEDITKEVWSRTLNNLPHLLSTKGTERAVRALINIYGLPPTVLRIKEYGGSPKEMTTSQYIKYENSGYSLNFDGGQVIHAPWGRLEQDNYSHMSFQDRPPETIELRFNASQPQTSMLIHSQEYWGIEIQAHPSASNTSSAYHNHGRFYLTVSESVAYESQTSSYQPIFDNDWWNIQFGITSAQVFNFHLKKAADHSNGRITHEEKIAWDLIGHTINSYIYNWLESAEDVPYSIGVGGVSTATPTWAHKVGSAGTATGFTGSMQELRYWKFPQSATAADYTILSDAAFDNHVLSPLSIEGNTYTSSYTDLVARWPLGSTSATASLTTATISSSHPNQSITTTPFISSVNATMSLSGSGFYGTSADWQYEEETFYTVVPEIIGTRAVSDKIRIDNSTFSGSLHKGLSVASSSIQLSAPDSPLLGVFFSPNDDIDLDISHTIGGAKFDDFVGNPRDAYRSAYKELRNIRNFYWKKYQASPTFAAYLKVLKYFDSSLFQQLESLLPARANKQTGLLIKPNLLERPTIIRVQEKFEDFTYEQVVNPSTLPKFSSYMQDQMEGSAKTYIVNGRDTHVNASSHLPNSFDDSLATSYGISNMASVDVPIYDKATVSRRYRTYTSGSLGVISTEVSAQDFLPAGIRKHRYAGTKYGIAQGSIGGIINLVNDPTMAHPGLFDSSTNIKCSIEVVETNPVELTTTQGPLTALGQIQIR
jgi:hypothetical protein